MPDVTIRYDVFLSHNRADKPAVEALARRLTQVGLTPFLDQWCLVPGEPWQEAIEEALEQSQSYAVFLGPNGIGPWENEEMRSAIETRVSDKSRRVIPVLLPGAPDPSQKPLPPFLRRLTWVDFRAGLDDAYAFHCLKCGILGLPPGPPETEAVEGEAIPEVGPLPPGSLMPFHHNPCFVGRGEELRALARMLQPGAAVAVGQVAAATGLGGIGKTQLAVEFVHRCGRRFPGGVFWLDFGDPATIAAQVAACGGRGRMNLSGFDDLKQPEQVAWVRAEWEKPTSRLLVFDNVDDPQAVADWRPTTGGCRILITSRRADWPPALGVQALALPTLPRPESLKLLLRAIPAPPDDPAANEICELLGDLPLAVALAGAYLAAYPHDVTPTKYLVELRAQPVLSNPALVDWVRDPSPTRHVQNVAATFDVSFARLSLDDPTDALARRLFHLAGQCAPAPIPREVLMHALQPPLPPVAEGVPEAGVRASHDALRRLAALGLVQIGAEGRPFLHRLLGEFARGRSPDPAADADTVEQAVAELAYEANESGLPARMAPLLPHLRHAAEQAATRGSEHAGRLFNSLGYHLHAVADLPAARATYQRALTIFERVLGPDHPNVATLVNNLGSVLHDLGDLPAARDAFQRALAIDEKAFGPDHPNVATDVNNLGSVLKDLGDLQAARDALQRALAIDEKAFGPDHPNVARDVNNLGTMLRDLGELQAARAAYERALAIDEKAFGPDHPEVARDVNNLGSVLHDLGELQAARAAFQRALAIFERLLGPDHPKTSTVRRNLESMPSDG
jgi:tetratricopeptide (TPR) repeat protein